MMNKKVILALTLVLVLGVGAGMGTMALYSKQFETNSNTVTAATFDPAMREEGKLFTFNNLQPGTEKKSTITLTNDSDVDTVFEIDAEIEGLLKSSEEGGNDKVTITYYDGTVAEGNKIDLSEAITLKKKNTDGTISKKTIIAVLKWDKGNDKWGYIKDDKFVECALNSDLPEGISERVTEDTFCQDKQAALMVNVKATQAE